MEIVIFMDEGGKFSVNLSDGLPLFVALGALEAAKSMLLNSNPPEEEIEEELQ